MFKIKRPAIVGLLLILLIFTGYLNYELTQQALMKPSRGYKEHEEAEKSNHLQEEEVTLDDDSFEIVDSVDSTDGEIAEVISSGKDRKSTRLNSSHVAISYAVFCLKKKK